MTEIQWIAKNVGTIGGLLTSEACDEFVRFSEERRSEEAPISTGRGAVMMKRLRNNDRVMLDDMTLSNQFYELLIRIIP